MVGGGWLGAGAGHASALGGAWGLALLQGLSSVVTLCALALLSKPVVGISWHGVWPVVLRIVSASAPGLAFVAGIEYLGARAAPADFSWDLALVAIAVVGGTSLYLWRARSIGLAPELALLRGALRRKGD